MKTLPPLVGKIAAGTISWKRVTGVDAAALGRMLCCHLVIEHYMDAFIRTEFGRKLKWDDVRLSFHQKLALLGGFNFPKRYDFRPELRHLNQLRNRSVHNIRARFQVADYEPFRSFLRRAPAQVRNASISDNEALEKFTTLVCAYFAGWISFKAEDAFRATLRRRAKLAKAAEAALASRSNGRGNDKVPVRNSGGRAAQLSR